MAGLVDVAKSLVVTGKGIFAADASPATLEKRAGQVGISLTVAEKRWEYRKVTLEAPGLGEYISGVILHDEIIRIPEARSILEKAGIMPGIKVDLGIKDGITQGLEGLAERLSEYRGLGAMFTKWRAVVTIGKSSPEEMAENAKNLAKYAKLAQEAGMVPVVEPEVLMDGDHDLETCAKVTEEWGTAVFRRLLDERVDMAGVVYKPNMILPGEDHSIEVEDEVLAQRTLEVMRKVVPVSVPGIAFLSGGQDAVAATRRLNLINKLDGAGWKLTFSFERALEGPAMEIWAGNSENSEKAQKVLRHRAKMNSLATMGKYTDDIEKTKD